MNQRNILKNEDAVSISIGFMLTFAISVIVFVSLILSFYSVLQNTEKSVMQKDFSIIGVSLSEKINTVDIISNSIISLGGDSSSIEYEFSLPASIAGKTYTLNLTDSPLRIIMESDNGARTVSPFNITSNIEGIKIYSGAENYKLIYNKNNNSITIKEE